MFLRSKAFSIIFAGLVGVATSIGTGHAAEPYRNQKYGFSLETPANVKLCQQGAPNPDHGLALLLVPSIPCEALSHAEAKIEVNGEFNASESRNVEELKTDICRRRGRLGVPPAHLIIDGLRTESCLVTSAKGKVEVWVVAQRNTGDDIDVWINYEIGLFTTKSRLGKDLETLRHVLGGMRLLKPA